MQYFFVRTTLAKGLSLMLFLVSAALLAIRLGLVAGIFSAIALWIFLASAFLLIIPFEKIKGLHLIIGLILTVLLELFMPSIINSMDYAGQ